MSIKQNIDDIVSRIRGATPLSPEIGLILGSGLGDYADLIESAVSIPYSDLPGFPVSTVAGHAGRFVLGERHGKTVIAMQGRVHYYEGYTLQEVTMPVRVMRKLGVKKLMLTNAAGGVNASFPVGSLMAITDHINYSGVNPLIGPNLDEFGPRFPDMSDVYSRALREKLFAVAAQESIDLQRGVYMMFSGPCYETPAEVRFARAAGADAVGMSTVPEAVVARHCGIEVLGISCITNFAAGILDAPLSHAEVVEVTARVNSQFARLVDLVLQRVF